MSTTVSTIPNFTKPVDPPETDFKLTASERELIDEVLCKYGEHIKAYGYYKAATLRGVLINRIEEIINEGWRNCLTQDD